MTHATSIPFNRPVPSGNEFDYIREAIEAGQLAGDGAFTERCEALILQMVGAKSAHLTHSCTAALEMAAILCDLGPGDEVIMPSFTFVSTANAVALRGATPVFVDIEQETLNIDPERIANAITSKTKAIWPIHYAGVVADMTEISGLAKAHNLLVVEDAAQALGSIRDGVPAGRFGDMAAFSFHETKNVISGEGGALVINRPDLTERAEIIREKGTNRSQFYRGMVDKYSWVDIGSSFLPGELVAAFLCAQLEAAPSILRDRLGTWTRYHNAFEAAEANGLCIRNKTPDSCKPNAHMYYLLLPSQAIRQTLITSLKARGITAPFHYVPLHSSTYGQKCSRTDGLMTITDDVSNRLMRLPLFPGLGDDVDIVIDEVLRALKR
ncbi:MAG: dTDP-4-amino-4,6-dideoxygalactose transaminase [Pseudomonadota bacterium]